MKQAEDDGELLKGQQANEIQKRSNRFEGGRVRRKTSSTTSWWVQKPKWANNPFLNVL